LIERNRKVIRLTPKGEKRFKRTTKADREKRKRELSDIICSWIAKP
jgi:DNA-binding PadR family transcriptional regulator